MFMCLSSPNKVWKKLRDSHENWYEYPVSRDWQIILLYNVMPSRSSSLGRVKNFLFSTSSRLPLGVIQPSIRWVPPGGKAAGAWSWPLTSNYCRGQENVDLYILSPIRLHGIVLNQLTLYHQWHEYGGRASCSCGSITIGVLLQSRGMLNRNRTSMNMQHLIRKELRYEISKGTCFQNCNFFPKLNYQPLSVLEKWLIKYTL
jgi:hypothetical protein